MKKVYISVAAACVLLIVILATGIWKKVLYPNKEEDLNTRIIMPREAASFQGALAARETGRDESITTKIPMDNGEVVIAVLNLDSEEGITEEQFVVFRYVHDAAKPLYITCIGYDEQSRKYKRRWDAPTSSTRSETISLFTQDLIGDRNNCIIVTGMNNKYEHTMTIFRQNSSLPKEQPYKKIAELQIDGSIVIQETTRSLAYQQGIANGQSFNIAAYGHDNSSANIMDQLETIYSYSTSANQYERSNVSRIPGVQIEQRKVKEILSGTPGVFENFIHDLWYYVNPSGTIDTKQYIFFDPISREIIFVGDEAQQVFQWHSSAPVARHGIYIRSQNISITTLLRFIDVKLESLDSIKLSVFEDVRLKIIVNTSWDGTYRRAGAVKTEKPKSSIKSSINALYDSSLGKLRFYDTGAYTLTTGNTVKNGRYVFYKVDENDLLELRPDDTENKAAEGRMVYKVETIGNSALILSRVRLGTTGILNTMEPPIMLTSIEPDH
jgi:hypothetical protein